MVPFMTELRLRLEDDETLTVREWYTRSHPVWAEWTHEQFTVAMRFLNSDGAPVLAEIRILPTSDQASPAGEWSYEVSDVPEKGIPSKFVKDLLVGGLRDQAMAAMGNPRDPAWGDGPFPELEWYDVLGYTGIDRRRTTEAQPKPGRNETAPLSLAKVAYFYDEALRNGLPKYAHVVKQMGDELTGQVGTWVMRAKDRGYIEGAPEGRAGGRLSDMARRLLEEAGFLPRPAGEGSEQ